MHSGYDTSPEGQAKKRARDAKLLMLDLEERPEHPFVLFNLGMTDHYCGEHEQAIEWFSKCLSVSGQDESHVRKAYALMSGSLRQLGRVDEALAALEKGLTAVGDDPELHFQLAHLLSSFPPNPPQAGGSDQSQSRFPPLAGGQGGSLERARDHYLKCLQSDPQGHYGSFDVAILGFKTWHNLASVCQAVGRYTEARDWWRKAVEAAPQFLPSAIELFGAALEAQDLATARAMLEHVRFVDGAGETWAQIGARYADTVSGPGGGEEFLRRAVVDMPESAGARLVLARRLLEQGREAEAEPLLCGLADAGVADAAFYLGVGATRRGELERALEWSEKALVLNPGHAQSEAAVHSLREALGVSDGPLADAVPLDAALEQLASDFGLDADELKAYAAEDTIGGYGATVGPAWPGGSVWEVEGQALYALVRALKPEVLVEVGSLVGCSTSHLAAACVRNDCGTVYAVDPHADFSRVSPELLEWIAPVKQDAFAWQPPDRIDFLFEDGTHKPGFTGGVLEHLAPAIAPGAAVLCHDYCRPAAATSVAAAFDEAVNGGRGILIAPSNCGLGYGRAPQSAVLDAAA